MHSILSQSSFINFMNLHSSNQSLLSQQGFTLLPQALHIPFFNPNDADHQNLAKIDDPSQVDENLLRYRLLDIFKKDKKKYQSICDKFMDVMEVEETCQNIRALTDFIKKTVREECKPKHDDQRPSQTETQSQSNQPGNHKNPLTIFSTQVSFLSTIFSRDKIEIILNVHTTHQKVLNFLNLMFMSLQNFNSTNEREWILLKDEIERYLAKYEKNVSKLFEVSESELKGMGVQGKSLSEKQNIQANQQTSFQSNTRNLGCEISSKLEEELNLKQYKSDILGIRQKIRDHQINLCNAFRNSFLAWYQKFETISENLKNELTYICRLVQKAKKFENSVEKYQIIDFLLLTRAKGLEITIFLEQIFKNFLPKLQKSRQELYSYITRDRKTKVMDSKSKDFLDLVNKEQKTTKIVEEIFKRIELLLGVKIDKSELYPSSKNDDVEAEGAQKNPENSKRTENRKKKDQSSEASNQNEAPRNELKDLPQKVKRIRKNKRNPEKKMEMNIILKSPDRKNDYMQKGNEISNQGNSQSQSNSQEGPKERQKMVSESPEQSESSSLEFLLGEDQVSRKSSDYKSIDSMIMDRGARKTIWNSPKNNLKVYEDIDSLSIGEQMDLDFVSFKSMESEEIMVFEKGFNDDEIKKMENSKLMDE